MVATKKREFLFKTLTLFFIPLKKQENLLQKNFFTKAKSLNMTVEQVKEIISEPVATAPRPSRKLNAARTGVAWAATLPD